MHEHKREEVRINSGNSSPLHQFLILYYLQTIVITANNTFLGKCLPPMIVISRKKNQILKCLIILVSVYMLLLYYVEKQSLFIMKVITLGALLLQYIYKESSKYLFTISYWNDRAISSLKMKTKYNKLYCDISINSNLLFFCLLAKYDLSHVVTNKQNCHSDIHKTLLWISDSFNTTPRLSDNLGSTTHNLTYFTYLCSFDQAIQNRLLNHFLEKKIVEENKKEGGYNLSYRSDCQDYHSDILLGSFIGMFALLYKPVKLYHHFITYNCKDERNMSIYAYTIELYAILMFKWRRTC